ncbi:DUF2726 domain-containing protein [Pontibacillus marinus]|uniref:Topoisomerase n=1 Tax=Pontibacillus marinus BH030004 = DSM 16465 TaxID=1385511 RepID=A0A0A5GES7_9BACI|nr:DUF2726 domain-containing protein [Pontibacillus marinus]KGX91726.1 topoisomerase [Pontibacillus marinus BH030004 = DSM 16465]
MSNQNPGCLGSLLKLIGIEKGTTSDEHTEMKLPYAIRDDFLSPAELSFYQVLNQVVDSSGVICPKVSLGDIFFVKAKDKSKHTTYLNKINRKHIDFLICDTATMKPVVGVELDDSSHSRQDRIKRDEFVNKLFSDAGLPLVRIANKRSYTVSEIKERIYPFLQKEADTSKEFETQVNSNQDTNEPTCKKCGSSMTRRIAKSGERKGKAFYGCSNFPKCREVVAID